jgi:hypothetical protein
VVASARRGAGFVFRVVVGEREVIGVSLGVSPSPDAVEVDTAFDERSSFSDVEAKELLVAGTA